MASSAPNKSQVVRSAAVLTTGEVAASSFDLNNAYASEVSVQIDFTLGMLTNGIFRFYVSDDGTTFKTLMGPTGAVLTQTYTANAANAILVKAPGWKWLRVSAQGTDTVTNSTATITLRYLQRGSQ